MKRTLQILAILAGLHLLAVAFYQVLMFQHELPHIINQSLPSPGSADTLLGSGAVLWVFHPFIATLIAMHLDLILPAPLLFVCESIVWAFLTLSLFIIIRYVFRHQRYNARIKKAETPEN